MRSLLTTILTATLTGAASLCGAQEQPPLHGPLDEAQVEHMLEMIEQHDPERHAELRRAMVFNPEEALPHLRHMVQYIHELEATKEQDLPKYELMKQQDEMERKARRLAEAVAKSENDDARQHAVHELHEHLKAWFELRHELRMHELERMSAEMRKHTKALHEKSEDLFDATNEWLGRITEGGEEGMKARIEHLRNVEEIHTLAPILVRMISREQPEIAQVLTKLAEASPDAFLKALHQIVSEHPQMVEVARKHTDEATRLHMHLQQIVLHLHELLLPYMGDVGHIDVPADVQQELEDGLASLIEAELNIVRTNLEKVGGELEHRREMIESRQERRDIIIEMQLSRMIGEEDRFEW